MSGADYNQWQFVKNEPNKVIGWAANGRWLENKDPATAAGLPAGTASTFLQRNAGNTAYEAKTVNEVWTAVSETNKFNQALTGSPWENVTVNGNTARIHRVADRLMVADAIQYTGGNTTGSAGTWMASDGTGSVKMDYLLINAGFASVTSAYVDSTTGGSSSYAVLGAARHNGRASGGIIGVAGYANNDGSGSTRAWGAYIEAKRSTVAAGSTHAMEANIVNIAAAPAGQSTPHTAHGGQFGVLALACGGDPTVNTTLYDAHYVANVVNNGAKFRRGIVVKEDAMVTDDGLDFGRSHFLSLPRNCAMEWYETDTETVGATVVGNVTDAAHRQELRLDNLGLRLFNDSSKPLFYAQWATNAVNAPTFIPGATGADVFLAFTGDDTNGSVSILGKGTGGVSLRDGANARKMQVNTTGIGFFGTAPVAAATGWAVDTGTAKRTSNATYSGTAEGAYTQATIQTLMNAVRDISQTIKALKDDLHQTAGYGLLRT